MCRFIWEWIYAKQIEPQDTRGIGGGLGGTNPKVWEAVKRLDRLAPNLVDVCGFELENGHRLNTICPSIFGGGDRGSQIQKSGEDVKRLIRFAPNLVHMCRFIWEWIYAKQIVPKDTMGHLGGFRGSNIQKSREAVKRLDRLASTLVHDGGFIWEWAYKYKSPLNTPGGMAGGGGVRGSQIQVLEAVKRLDQLAPNLVHVCGFIWEWI